MTGKEKEITDLFGQHDAIRAQMKFLTNSLKELAVQPDLGIKKSAQVKEQLQSYCYALRDLRDGVITHIELDERIFGVHSTTASDKRMETEHKSIRKQIDRAIQLADEAIDGKLSGDELNRRASEIADAVDKIRKLIGTHTAKEDSLLKAMR
ncbi:MAG TPA: hypothetical protein VGA85_00935 [Dehalococcoidales bacterium]